MTLRPVLLLIATIALAWITPIPAIAATLRVCPTGCAYGSIQAAINAAQTGDTLKVAPGTYTENLLMIAPLAATELTIQGSGAGKTIVDGNQQGCVLEIDTPYTLTVRGMTLTNGACDPGGGVANHGTMTLVNVIVRNNFGDPAGGIANDVDSTLTMIRGAVSDNQSPNPLAGQGGGIFNLGTISLTDTTISGNTAPVQGGGIENNGTLSLTRCRITNNSVAGIGVGGGIENHTKPGVGVTATVTLKNSTITGNSAFAGGGLYNRAVLTMIGSPIRGNSAQTAGAGLLNAFGSIAELIDSPVTTNSSNLDGGGVYNDRGTLTMTNSPIKNNAATSNSGDRGGGLAIFGGTVQLNRSRVSQNYVSGPIGAQGGGIFISSGNLTLNRSPVNANNAGTDGGGIYLFNGGSATVTLQNSPVRNNTPNNCTNVPGC